MSVLISTCSELELLRLNIISLKYRVTPGGVGGEDQLTLRELTVSGVSITSVGGEGGPVNSNSSSISACIIVQSFVPYIVTFTRWPLDLLPLIGSRSIHSM